MAPASLIKVAITSGRKRLHEGGDEMGGHLRTHFWSETLTGSTLFNAKRYPDAN